MSNDVKKQFSVASRQAYWNKLCVIECMVSGLKSLFQSPMGVNEEFVCEWKKDKNRVITELNSLEKQFEEELKEIK